MVQRERFEAFEKQRYLGRMLMLAFNLDPAQVARAEQALELAVFQTAWDPVEIQQHMENVRETMRQERELRLRDARVLDSVARMSEPDEDEPDAFPASRVLGKTRMEGIDDPWSRGK